MLTPKQRREIAAGANRLKTTLTIAAGEPSPSVAAHVQRALKPGGVIKVRINTDDRETCHAIATQLAQQAGVELAQVLGRVAVFFRPADDVPDSDDGESDET